jgi:hypothetical protein
MPAGRDPGRQRPELTGHGERGCHHLERSAGVGSSICQQPPQEPPGEDGKERFERVHPCLAGVREREGGQCDQDGRDVRRAHPDRLASPCPGHRHHREAGHGRERAQGRLAIPQNRNGAFERECEQRGVGLAARTRDDVGPRGLGQEPGCRFVSEQLASVEQYEPQDGRARQEDEQCGDRTDSDSHLAHWLPMMT